MASARWARSWNTYRTAAVMCCVSRGNRPSEWIPCEGNFRPEITLTFSRLQEEPERLEPQLLTSVAALAKRDDGISFSSLRPLVEAYKHIGLRERELSLAS